MRYDLDGDGEPTVDGATAYAAAFSTVGDRQVCGGPAGCVGYELGADLDFDTKRGNGEADASDTVLERRRRLGASPNRAPVRIRGDLRRQRTHHVANLFIGRRSFVGLFGTTTSTSVIRHVGLIDVSVAGRSHVGSSEGSIVGCYATGAVAGTRTWAGGLVGAAEGSIAASYAAATVTDRAKVGGLAGEGYVTTVTASDATGRVAGSRFVGGLVGFNQNTITASYGTGPVWGERDVGGLVGSSNSLSTVTASYWDTTTSRRTTGSGGQGRTTAQLQTPTGYTGIYAHWNVDLDGDTTGDSPWHFGTDSQYPVLAVDVNGTGGAMWQELDYQLRDAATLTATGTDGGNEVALSWTAVTTSHWTSAPGVAYTVTQDDGTSVTVVADGINGTSATDTAVVSGGTCTYQVMAAAGGAVTHSAPQSLTVSATGRRRRWARWQPARCPCPAARRASTWRCRTACSRWTCPVGSPTGQQPADVRRDIVAPTVASVTVARSIVSVTSLSGGTARITLTATDLGGSRMSAMQTFTVTVANRAPVAVGTLAALSLRRCR